MNLYTETKQKIVSSLTDDVEIRKGRRVGNTTRIIDNIIQLLFDDKIVHIQDHYGNDKESSNRADEHLLQQLLKRMEFQFHLSVGQGIDLDKKNMLIRLTPKYLIENTESCK